MTSNVTCDYPQAAWEVNVRNETACQVYAELQAQCDSSFIIQPVIQTSPPYTPPNNACGCNVVAYNLMAGCAWCQLPIQAGWWLPVSQWAGNCTDVQFNPTSVPQSISTDNIIIPQWALAVPTGTTWNPAQASDIAIPPSSTTSSTTSTTPLTFTPSTPSSHTTTSLSPIPPFATNPSLLSASSSNDAGQTVGITFGVILGLWALSTVLVVGVYFERERRRRGWVAPLAAFWQAQKSGYGGGRGGGGGAGGAGGRYSQYPPNTPHGAAGSTVPLIYPHQNSTSTVPTTTTGYQPPPPPPSGNSTGFNSSTAGGYNATPYVPPPPESNYRGAQGGIGVGAGAPGGYGTPGVSGAQQAWGPNGVGDTSNVYGSGGGGGSASGVYGSRTTLGTPGRGGAVAQAPPPGSQGAYRGHAEVH